jgi:DNA-binding NtrC family response regulator
MEKISAILIVDDDPDVQQAARLALTSHAERVEIVSSPEGIAPLLTAEDFDCVLLDMNFVTGDRSGKAGLNALAAIRQLDPSLSVVLMTGYGAVSLAVESLKQGAGDFLLKPWRNDTLIAAVRTAAAKSRAERDDTPLDMVERVAIEKALLRHEGNIAQTAVALGLSRPALYRRMTKHGL